MHIHMLQYHKHIHHTYTKNFLKQIQVSLFPLFFRRGSFDAFVDSSPNIQQQTITTIVESGRRQWRGISSVMWRGCVTHGRRRGRRRPFWRVVGISGKTRQLVCVGPPSELWRRRRSGCATVVESAGETSRSKEFFSCVLLVVVVVVVVVLCVV